MIDAEDRAFDRIPGNLWFWDGESHEVRDRISETGRLPRFREPRRNRRKNIAPMERIAHRIAEVMLRSNIPDVQSFRLVVDGGKNAIIGRDKIVLVARDKNRTPRRTDSWVNHDEMNGFGREIFESMADGQRAIKNIVSNHSVSDINYIHFGIYRENDAFEHSDEMVGGPIVSRQRNDRAGQCLLLSLTTQNVKCVVSSTLTEAYGSVKTTAANE